MRSRLPGPFVVALIALGAVISVDVVPGVFSVDDNNHLINVLALRQGRVTVPQTDGLPPSPELLFFDPGPWARQVTSTPVASTAPPLYAPIALPFSFIGWRGLVALNTLAYLATTLMVFVYARRHSARESTPWLAAAAFALGGYSIEYAEGVWPHMLSVALCTGGILAAGRVIEGHSLTFAALSGSLLGIAAGVRYQNIVILGGTAAAFAVLARHRTKSLIALVLAAAIPLAVSSAVNHARQGSWNPISKGPGYLSVATTQGATGSLFDPAVMFWARLVDYAARPPLTSPSFAWQTYDPDTGAHIMPGLVVKKAVLQSSPWVIVALAMFVMAWSTRAVPEGPRDHLRLFSIASAAVLAAISFSGIYRDDGFNFNQRYLLELVPMAAIGLAWAMDGMALRRGPVIFGAVVAAGGVVAILLGMLLAVGTGTGTALWRWLLLKSPLLLALGLVLSWGLARRGRAAAILSACLGLALGWAITLHVADDLRASHRTRAANLRRTRLLDPVVQSGSVLVAYWGNKDSAVPLLLDREFLILDARADEGRDGPRLIRHLLEHGRRVLLLEDGFPDEVLRRVVRDLYRVPVPHDRLRLVELKMAG